MENQSGSLNLHLGQRYSLKVLTVHRGQGLLIHTDHQTDVWIHLWISIKLSSQRRQERHQPFPVERTMEVLRKSRQGSRQHLACSCWEETLCCRISPSNHKFWALLAQHHLKVPMSWVRKELQQSVRSIRHTDRMSGSSSHVPESDQRGYFIPGHLEDVCGLTCTTSQDVGVWSSGVY